MRIRRDRGSKHERASAGDSASSGIWQAGHLGDGPSSSPVIKAPRAGDLVSHDAA